MQIERLTRADADEAIEVLCAAFVDYPVMRFILADAGPDYDAKLHTLAGYFCNKRLARGWPVLGVRHDGKLAAVALISVPSDESNPPEVRAMRDELAATIGAAAMERFDRYGHESELDAPTEPCHFVGMIGVHPDHQGHGLARVLMDEIARMSASHPDSTGICLNTEVESNVGFYEHLGYQTLGKRNVGDMITWCMFRPDES